MVFPTHTTCDMVYFYIYSQIKKTPFIHYLTQSVHANLMDRKIIILIAVTFCALFILEEAIFDFDAFNIQPLPVTSLSSLSHQRNLTAHRSQSLSSLLQKSSQHGRNSPTGRKDSPQLPQRSVRFSRSHSKYAVGKGQGLEGTKKDSYNNDWKLSGDVFKNRHDKENNHDNLHVKDIYNSETNLNSVRVSSYLKDKLIFTREELFPDKGTKFDGEEEGEDEDDGYVYEDEAFYEVEDGDGFEKDGQESQNRAEEKLSHSNNNKDDEQSESEGFNRQATQNSDFIMDDKEQEKYLTSPFIYREEDDRQR